MSNIDIDKFKKIEIQFEYSIYLIISTCLISLYASFSIYQKQKPIGEIDSLKGLIRIANNQNKELYYYTRSKEIYNYTNELRDKIDRAVERQLHYRLDWGLFNMSNSNINKIFFPIANNTTIDPGASLNQILDTLDKDVNFIALKNFTCRTSRSKITNSEIFTYYNVKDVICFEPSPGLVDKKYLNIKILTGKSPEKNTLVIGEEFNITCACSIDTVTLKRQYNRDWIFRKFPWISNNLSLIGNKDLRQFDQIWMGSLAKEILNEEIPIVGLKIQTHSLFLVSMTIFISIFIFHLSILAHLTTEGTAALPEFSSAILYKNNWAKLLQFFVWFFLPTVSTISSGYFISDSLETLFWIIPNSTLGIYIISQINNFNNSSRGKRA
jgi:hypothetical protein